jgi:hypothetical protein
MKYIKFVDKCKIERSTGQLDNLDREITNVIYDGECLYCVGGQTSLSVIVRDDIVFLPSNDVMIYENDIVSGIRQNGREFKAYVKVVRDIRLPLSGQEYTRLELRQSLTK